MAEEILYIFEAPKLELGEDSFIKIPDMSKLEAFDAKKSKGIKFNKGNQGYAKIEPGPDPYSIEWIKEQRLQGPAEMDLGLPAVVAAISIASLVFLR